MSIDNDTDTPVRFGRPPNADEAEFNADMAALARLGRQCWSQPKWINSEDSVREFLDAVPDAGDDLLCDFIPGCDSDLDLAACIDNFARIGDDIRAIAGVA